MESNENTNWGQSVAAVIIHENKVLLTRHTYGAGKGMLIIPGGYVNQGESPQEALKREVFEETGITVIPLDIVGIRFNAHDWYVVFRTEYISGVAKSDNKENNEVVWIDINEVISRNDVPELTVKLINSIINKDKKLKETPYNGNVKNAPYSLYC